MKRKILAVVMASVLVLAMGMTALAAESGSSSSSSTGSHSSGSKRHSGGGSSSGSSSSSTGSALGEVATNTVQITAAGADGSVTTTNFAAYLNGIQTNYASYAASAAAQGIAPGAALSAALSRPASLKFQATVDALGGRFRLNDQGCYKVKSTVAGADGSTIVSCGVVKGTTQYAIMILTSVNTDGTTEVVEGVYDEASGHVLGTFNGTPQMVNVFIMIGL